jgi:hypothetical protein
MQFRRASPKPKLCTVGDPAQFCHAMTSLSFWLLSTWSLYLFNKSFINALYALPTLYHLQKTIQNGPNASSGISQYPTGHHAILAPKGIESISTIHAAQDLTVVLTHAMQDARLSRRVARDSAATLTRQREGGCGAACRAPMRDTMPSACHRADPSSSPSHGD